MSIFRKRRASVAAVGATLAITLVGAAPAYAGYTKLHDNGTQGVLMACKTPEGGGYGPVWKISLLLAASQSWPNTSARVDVMRGSQLIARTDLSTSYPGQWVFGITYASRVWGDWLKGSHGWGGGGGFFDTYMSSVGDC